VKCPGCGAVFRAPETARTFTCPYCGLVFGEKKPEEDHYYFPVIREEPYGILLRYLQRQFGAPSDIALNSSLRARTLHYVPVYFYYIYGRAAGDCGRRGWTEAEEGAYIGVVASRRFAELLRDYPFPVRGKRFFSEEVYELGEYHEPEFGEDEARRKAEDKLSTLIYGELGKQCSDIRRIEERERRVEYRGLVHYPVYHLIYSYGGVTYQAYIDGSDGKVITAEHPLKLQARAVQLAVSAALFIIAFIVGAAFSMSAGTFIPLIPPIIAAAVTSIPLLKRTIARKITTSELKTVEGEQESFAPIIRRL